MRSSMATHAHNARRLRWLCACDDGFWCGRLVTPDADATDERQRRRPQFHTAQDWPTHRPTAADALTKTVTPTSTSFAANEEICRTSHHATHQQPAALTHAPCGSGGDGVLVTHTCSQPAADAHARAIVLTVLRTHFSLAQWKYVDYT